MSYPLLKALHIMFMVTWFAGLFYLPRLYVYHAMAADDAAGCARFKIMERKLFWGIMTPGAILTILFGIAMVLQLDVMDKWLHVKIMLVVVLVIYHIWCGKILKNFKLDCNTHSHVWYRWFNELPVLILIPVVLLAVLKPF